MSDEAPARAPRMLGRFKIGWRLRSTEPAKVAANPDFPAGVEVDLAGPASHSCLAELTYPAKGVGTHLIECSICGVFVAVTAAGRADDPRAVVIACETRGGIRPN